MLTDTELPLCPSSSSHWVECLSERGPSSVWVGVIWFCATIRLSGHNSELSEHVSHTPQSSWETGSDSVCDCVCRVSWALRWQCVGTAGMQHPDAGSQGIPLLTQSRTGGICCHISVNSRCKTVALQTDKLLGNYRSLYYFKTSSIKKKDLSC